METRISVPLKVPVAPPIFLVSSANYPPSPGRNVAIGEEITR